MKIKGWRFNNQYQQYRRAHPGLGLGLYSISKATLIAMTKVLAREWGVDSIRANVICPGLVKTKFSEALTSNDKIMKMVMAKQALPTGNS